MSSIDSDRLETAAFWCLAGSAFGAAFSLPLGRALLAISLLSLVLSMIGGRRLPRIPQVGWLAAIFIVVAIVATMNGVNPDLGVPKLRKLFWFVGIPVCFMLINSSYRAEMLLRAYAVGAGILALDVGLLGIFRARAVLKAGMFDNFTDALIHVGSITDGQRLMLGILIGVGILLVKRRRNGRAGWGWWVLLAVLVITQIMNFKRGSWFCTLFFVTWLVAFRGNWRYALAPVALVLVLAFVPAVQVRIGQLSREFQQPGGRVTMWTEVTPALIKHYPWGIGYRSLTNQMMREINGDIERDRDHLHSNLAQVLVATGWLGFTVYLLWMLRAIADSTQYTMRVASKGQDTIVPAVWLVLLFALLTNGLVEYNFGDGELVLAYGMIFGTCAAGVRGFG